MNGTFDIIIPDIRGTGKSTWLGCGASDASVSCQSSLEATYGSKLQAFSVDEMAYDTLMLISLLKQPNDVVYAYGLNFGSYLISRVLQINPQAFDAVLMDGACGTNCNASDIDIQRNILATSIVNQCTNMNGTCTDRLGRGFNLLNALSDVVAKLDRGIYICSIPYNIGITPKAAIPYMVFDRNFRAVLPATIFRLTRCNPKDNFAGPRLGLFAQSYLGPVPGPNFSPLLAQHVILSEFGRTMSVSTAVAADNTLFTTRQTSSYAKALASGWKLYDESIYRYTVSNYTNPILMLNGDSNPYSPLSRATAFAANFTNQNQQFVTIPGASYSTMFDSPMINSTSHCAYTMALSFYSNPKTAVNTSCVSSVLPLSFEETPTTLAIFEGSVYEGILKFNDAYVNNWMFTIGYSLVLMYGVFGFMLLLINRKQQPVQSRFIAPYIAIAYLIVVSITSLFSFIGKLIYQIVPIYWLQSIYLMIILLAIEAYMIQTIRYVLLRRMYGMMFTSTKFNVKLFKSLTSNWGYIIAMISSSILVGGFISLVTPLNAFYGSAWNYVLIVGLIIFMVIFVLITSFVIIYDAFTGYKCNVTLKSFFITDDPLCFRVEMTALFLPTLATGALGLGLYTIFPTSIPIGVLVMVFHIFACLYAGGYVLLVVFIRKIRAVTSPHLKNEDVTLPHNLLTKILADEMGSQIVSTYCKNEFSFENFACWRDTHNALTTYRDMQPDERRKSLAHICTTYIESGSEMEVNIDGYTKKKVTELVRGNSFTEEEGATMLRTMNEDMLKNLEDTFSRLKHTEEFAKVIQAIEMKSKIMSDAKLG
jgi:pimeloyl-ACP methyl ester carboxylesterase